MADNNLVILSGPSEAGKTTLAKYAIEEFDLYAPVSCTTRLLRKNEVEGREYRHMSMDQFLRARRQGAFVEWAEVHGNYYATLARELEMCFMNGDTLLEIDYQGAHQIKEKHPKAVLVLIVPRNRKQLRERLENRGTDSPEVIDRRLSKAVLEIESAHPDAFIINDDLDRAKLELKSLIIDLKGHGRISLLKYNNPVVWQMTLSALRA